MKNTCETCSAFNALIPHDPCKPKEPVMGECRASSPKVLATYNTPQGASWQAGWPPVQSNQWCREYRAKMGLVPTEVTV